MSPLGHVCSHSPPRLPRFTHVGIMLHEVTHIIFSHMGQFHDLGILQIYYVGAPNKVRISIHLLFIYPC